ncbi:MAG: HAD family hydrolase [Methanosarcinaceae archaeon]|nr:HAD family hydrolase [Methanosarcinaceae archaeon]
MQQLLDSIKSSDLVIFDLDGTIVYMNVDWSKVKKELSDHFYNSYGIKESFNPMLTAIEKMIDKFGIDTRFEIYNILKKHELNAIENSTFNEYIVTLIRNMPLEKKLAIFSTNLHETIESILEKVGLLVRFEYIVGLEDVRYTKPNPEGINNILDHFKVNNSKALFIADKFIDFEVGKSCNIKTYDVKNL